MASKGKDFSIKAMILQYEIQISNRSKKTLVQYWVRMQETIANNGMQ